MVPKGPEDREEGMVALDTELGVMSDLGFGSVS